MATFDRCYCITLARREDRWKGFLSRLPQKWTLPTIRRFFAVDGSKCLAPAWWTSGRGAWGCYRSHLSILEQCLSDGVDSVLILEDDCTIPDDFCESIGRLDVPSDCEQLYLGGQHLIAPTAVDGRDDIVLCRNANRTHAYAVTGKPAIEKLYRALNDTKKWTPRFHIDHTYGRLHETGEVKAYATSQWLCGQAAGMSDVCERKVSDRSWNHVPPQRDMPFVAVMGLHRSGSSALAMMCHKLGISMGRKLTGWEGRNGGGGEAVTLAWICEQWARFPSVSPSTSFDAVGHMRAWIAGRVADDSRSGLLSGGKYPSLCAMGHVLQASCGRGLKIIDIRRPIEQSIESLVRRSAIPGSPAADAEQCERVQRWLWEQRESFLADFDSSRVHRVEYDEVLSNPKRVAAGVLEFCGLSVTDSSVDAACEHIYRYAAKTAA